MQDQHVNVVLEENGREEYLIQMPFYILVGEEGSCLMQMT